LVLEDGVCFDGTSFGAGASVSGEVVFNTAMTGYPESLTDPSYRGQLLVLTYPLVGNYGVPDFRVEDNGIPRYFESDKIHISGLIISDYSYRYSHWNAKKSLSQWLKEHNIPGIYGIDTRALTRHIREKGAMPGKILYNGDNPENLEFFDPNTTNLAAEVSTKKRTVYGSGTYTVLLVDCGVKYNIIRCLLDRDITVIRVPWDHDLRREQYDGLFISNGPGDPRQCTEVIKNLQWAFGQDKPVFGICLGNQLMALAGGAECYKLKYGHRGHNQPVLRKDTPHVYITSQNHGYTIDNSTLSDEWEPLFINLNDRTNEGMRHGSKPFFSVQFHPEASGGPSDTAFLFDDFVQIIKDRKTG
jgi:carbamoyl-phosphate synthase small subunit